MQQGGCNGNDTPDGDSRAMLVIHQMFWREFEAIADLA